MVDYAGDQEIPEDVCAPTICSDCDHMHNERTGHPRYWMCMKFPRTADGFGFVTDTVWDKAAPYMYCVDINGGVCPLFEPRRNEDDQR